MLQPAHRLRVGRACAMCLIAIVPVVLLAQSIPDRPGASRPAQLSRPRIAPLNEAQWTDAHRQRLEKCLPAGTPVGNGFRTLVNVPELVDHTLSFHNYIQHDSSLPARV